MRTPLPMVGTSDRELLEPTEAWLRSGADQVPMDLSDNDKMIFIRWHSSLLNGTQPQNSLSNTENHNVN